MPERDRDDEQRGFVIGPTSGGPDVEMTGGRGETGSAHSDEEIRDEIRARLAASSLAGCALEVRVVDGIVTVGGRVPDEAALHLAQHIAESVAGAREMRSELTVERRGSGGRAA